MNEIEKQINKLRTKIGVMKKTIDKKNHVIRTIDHHNNRLINDNNAKESCIKCRDKEIELLVDLLKENGIESELLNFTKRVEMASRLVRERG